MRLIVMMTTLPNQYGEGADGVAYFYNQLECVDTTY